MRIMLVSKLTDAAECAQPDWIKTLEQTLISFGHETQCVTLPFENKSEKEFTESSLSIKFLTVMNVDRVVVLEPAMLQITHSCKIGLFIPGDYERLQISHENNSQAFTNTTSIDEFLFSAPLFDECHRIICSPNDAHLAEFIRNCDTEVVAIPMSAGQYSTDLWSRICAAIVA